MEEKTNETMLQISGKINVSPEEAKLLAGAYEMGRDIEIKVQLGMVQSLLQKTHKDGKDDHIFKAKATFITSLDVL